MSELSNTDRKALRGQAMRLKPSVLIGKNGLSDNTLKELETALARDQLIKVRFGTKDREAIKTLCSEIETKAQATLCGQVGSTASFYRKAEE